MTESEALQLFDTLPYKTKVNLYTRCFSSGNMVSGKLESKLDLIKLICFVTFKLRKENKELTVKEVIEKITGKNLDNPREGMECYLLGLSIVCEDFLYEVKDIQVEGFNSSKDIIIKIKSLLDGWFPF